MARFDMEGSIAETEGPGRGMVSPDTCREQGNSPAFLFGVYGATGQVTLIVLFLSPTTGKGSRDQQAGRLGGLFLAGLGAQPVVEVQVR